MRRCLCGVLLIYGWLGVMTELQSCEADRHSKYLNFLHSYFPNELLGSFRRGEIEIVQDVNTIKNIEEVQRAIFLKNGCSKESAEASSRIGIISEDEYWIWVRDGVIFPTGAKGTYNRMICKRALTETNPKVAILPLLPNGKIVLNLNYRHALRKWVLEIPRGLKKQGESDEKAVVRQLKEETGYEILSSSYLGNVSFDSGSFSSQMPVYLAKVGEKKFSNQDYSEAILRLEEMTLDQVRQAMAEGSITLDIKGQKEKVEICDAYLAYALLQAETKGALLKEKKK